MCEASSLVSRPSGRQQDLWRCFLRPPRGQKSRPCLSCVRYLKSPKPLRGPRLTDDNVRLGSSLLHKLSIIKCTVDELGLGVFLLDRLGFLFAPDEEGELPVRVRVCDDRVGVATDVACTSVSNLFA